ncbi:short-chain fatty acid transporter [Natronorubrum halophilum]|uniref:short-chain fatty acid transporter n=1 Tax=Natronorubrum halophilum TaxID=1702106 RepID=UPI0010C21AD4|nr:TIGR00366 family protein [Natronorubrum halophilum]
MPESTTGKQSIVERLGAELANRVERWMPSPFLFAIILTYIVYVAAVLGTDAGVFEAVEFWYDGFWAFLTFAMQMVLVLMTGFVVAYHPRVNAGLQRLSRLPSNGKQAVVLVGVVSMMLAWIHWGLGLIIGAIFAREMGKTTHQNGIAVHYPLLCVAGYMGLGLTWHWGLSGSAPLLLATEGNEFIEMGVLEETVPTSATILHPYALTLTTLSIVFASIVLYLLSPSPGRSRPITEYIPEDELFETTPDGGEVKAKGENSVENDPDERVPAERLNNSRLMGGLIALTGLVMVGYTFVTLGLDALDLNVVNFAFLMAGLAIYTQPQVYRDRFGDASSAAAGVILLFPFFAGIQGIMASSGLAELIADGLLAVSSPATFPVFAWLTAAVTNMFVPSGGGEWIVLGPSVIEAAQAHGIPAGHATIAYAVGDAHTNLLNPFWALPLLAITRIKAREMFGYAIAMLLLLIPFLAIALYLVPY